MTIREAIAEDLDRIAALYVSNWKTTYRGLLTEDYLDRLDRSRSAEKWSAFLSAPDHHVFVACDAGRFLGFGACAPDPDIPNCLYLDSLHVCADAQGTGVGTRLIQTIGAYAAGRNDRMLSVCIVRGNDRARALYEKLGAVHHCYFTDDFGGALSSSEKLVWQDLSTFAK